MSPKKLLVRGARQLLTLQGPREPRRGRYLNSIGLIADGAVLISNGIITAVGSSRRVENLSEARSAAVINASGKVVMPGFVDCEIQPLDRQDHALATHVLDSQVKRLLALCMVHGTTTMEAKVLLTENRPAHVRALRIIGESGAPVHCCSVIQNLHGPMEELALVLKRARGRNLSQSVEVVCGTGGLPQSDAEVVLETIRRVGFRRKVRAVGGFEQATAELASTSGAVVVSGWCNTSESTASTLARTQAIASVIPEQATSLAVRLLIDRGVPVAISTGLRSGPPGTLSMQAVLRAAVREYKMSLDEAISAATLNAAYAAGHGDHAGSIEFGKEADLLILDASDYRELGEYHGMNLAALCLKRGEVMYRRQEFSWP